jgi:hypothetical protein
MSAGLEKAEIRSALPWYYVFDIIKEDRIVVASTNT